MVVLNKQGVVFLKEILELDGPDDIILMGSDDYLESVFIRNSPFAYTLHADTNSGKALLGWARAKKSSKFLVSPGGCRHVSIKLDYNLLENKDISDYLNSFDVMMGDPCWEVETFENVINYVHKHLSSEILNLLLFNLDMFSNRVLDL